MITVDVFSFGAGVQSVAVMVAMAEGLLPRVPMVFANVGPDSEHPATIAYYYEHAVPYATRHRLVLEESWRRTKDGRRITLLEHLITKPASVPIPVRVANGSIAKRSCTMDWKSRVVAKWLKEQGYTAARPAALGIGISWDEASRMRNDSAFSWVRLVYPLIDLRYDRHDCTALIRTAGLPEPPKSACWWCPFKRLGEWRRMKLEEPALFRKAVALERLINMRRKARGQHPLWFTDALVPLDKAVGPGLQLSLLPEGRQSCAPFACSVA